MKLRKIQITGAFIVIFYHSVIAQTVVIPGERFTPSKMYDTLELSYHPAIKSTSEEGFHILNPFFKNSFNTGYPRGYNDGAVWKGKGLTSELHGGVQYNKGVLSMTFHPVVYFSQNLSFNLAPQNFKNLSPYAYQVNNDIDWVQRYGNSSFAKFYPGQSEIKVTLGKFVASLSTQNFTLGPSIFNPIIMSNQGPGFPHLRIGVTPTTVHIKDFNLFKFEANVFYGLLFESKYYDQNKSNNKRFIDGLALSISPSFFPNLTVGFHRFMYKDTQYFRSRDFFSPIKIIDNGVVNGDTLSPNDTFDQLASLSVSWNFPQIGFRAFGEFAKNDFTGNWFRWTLLEPEHARAYSLGFEKFSQLTEKISLSMTYEHTNLTLNSTYLWRAVQSYYVHDINLQGYTNIGQLLGAGIGPGSNTDRLNFLLSIKNYRFGLFGQRIQFNEDHYIKDKNRGFANHNVEYTFGIKLMKEYERFKVGVEWYHSKMFNQYFMPFNDKINNYFSLSVKSKLYR